MAKFSLSDLGSVFKMIGLIKANPGNAAEIIAEIPEDIVEAIKAQSAMGFEGTKEVKDVWQGREFHRNPTTGEIPVGPALAARGGQVHREIGIYSDLEAQEGLSQQQIDFQRTMSMMQESMKSLATGIQFLVTKAAEDKEEDKMADEEAEKAESDAKKSLEKAQTLVSRAIDLRDDADCETGEARKALIVKSKNLRINAGHELAKAQLNARAIASVKAKAASSASILSAIKALAEKANVVIKAKEDDEEMEKSEEDEKREEAEKAKAAAEAEAKSKEMPPQNVTEKSAAETAAAAKAAEEAAKAAAPPVAQDLAKAIADMSALLASNQAATNDAITKALNGQKLLEGNVHTLMDAISGGSIKTASPAAPDLGALMKGNPQAGIEKIADYIATASDGGRLDDRSTAAAQSLLGQLDAVHKGVIDISVFNGKLAKAPASVQSIFAEVANAA